MVTYTTDLKREISEAKLAEMPLEPSSGFSRRVMEECLNCALEQKLKELPVNPSPDFTDRIMAKIETENSNTVAFPLRFARKRSFRRISVAGIAGGVVALGISLLVSAFPQRSLSERVANVLDADPELAAMVAVEEEFSFNELLAVSQLLTTLNKNSAQTADFFAYYEN